MRHFVITLFEKSLMPLLCMRASNSLPCSSTKLTLVKSTSSAISLDGHVCQHLSSSSTHGPESLPSRKSPVTNDSCCGVILVATVLAALQLAGRGWHGPKGGLFNPCNLLLKSLHDFARCSTCYR